VKNFRSPQRPKKSALITGRRAVLEALQTGKALERIYLQTGAYGFGIEDILSAAARERVPVSKVPPQKLATFNVENHEGCIAQMAKVQYQDLQQVISWIVDKGEAPLLLILDGITDIRNIGGIARTALCTGVHALIIPDKGVGMLNEDALLTSAGALEQLPVCRVVSLMKTVDELHLNGIKVVASEMTAKKTVQECNFHEPVAIVMGSEDKGIYPALMKVCDEQVKIPMAGNFESLNVSVAAGMILYEAMMQRKGPPTPPTPVPPGGRA
jgi:23S rRNA (guanosine2251-2'-O)-methyltransferase